MDRHVLFYSNHCQYSLQIVSAILQKGLKPEFTFVEIDNPIYASNLPAFVDRVPMICTKFKNIVVDDDVLRFVQMLPVSRPQQVSMNNSMGQHQDSVPMRNGPNTMNNPNTNVTSFQQQNQNEGIAPFMGTLSQEFAIVNANGYPVDTGISCNDPNGFAFISDTNRDNIQTPLAEEPKQKIDSAEYDNFLAQRNRDYDLLKPPRQI